MRSALDYDVDAILLDAKHHALRGGTGRVFDWSIAIEARRAIPKLYLAGGLGIENIEDAINSVDPFAVDACSALEETPGKKSHERMRAFVRAIRSVKP